MKIDYTGRGTEVTPALRAALEKRLKKAEERVGELAHVHAILSVLPKRARQKIELVCKIGRKQYIAEGESGDMYASIEAACDALILQLRKINETRRDKRRKSENRRRPAAAAAPAPEPADGDSAPAVTRVAQPALKPMSLKMATLLLASRPEPVLVYTSSETGRLAVLFRRDGGGCGLIEP